MFWFECNNTAYCHLYLASLPLHSAKMPPVRGRGAARAGRGAARGREKQTRRMLTLSQKIEVIKRLERGERRASVMAEFNVSSSTLYDIKKQKDSLMQFYTSATEKTMGKRKTIRKPKMDELDKVLYEWFKIKRAAGKPVTGPVLVAKGKLFAEEMGLEDMCGFSQGWLQKFKKRHSIRKLDVAGETQSSDRDAADAFTASWESLVEEHHLSPHQVYNADETALYYRCLPTSTLASEEESGVKGYKKNKDRLTVLLCANASGTHRVKPLVIGKSERPRAFRGLTHLPVNYKAQKSAWMTSIIF